MNKLTRVFRIAGGVFLGLVILMVLINAFKKNIYNSKLGINVLMLGKNGAGIISIRPSTGLVSYLRLPDNLSIPVDLNGAEYQVEAIYKIGLPLLNPLDVARTSVGQSLGVVLSGVVKTSGEFGVPELREAMISIASKTNLSVLDRYLLFKDLSELIIKKTTLGLALPKNVMDEVDEPDGKKINKLNAAIYVWSRNQWLVDEVLSETAEVAVVNASGTEGRARQVSRQVESAGIRVIDLLVSKKELKERCLLFGNLKSHPITADFLISSFRCTDSKNENISDYLERDVKSDIVLVLGKGI